MAIVQHQDVMPYELQGNVMLGLATPSRGAREVEVWHTRIIAGAATPPHVHGGEEVVVVLRGRGELHVGGEVMAFEGPCTLIAPAHVPHQIINTGEEATEAIAVLPLGSTISTPEGEELVLPWRG